MDIISAYREVGTYRGAAAISGTTPKTVQRVIAGHESGEARPMRAPRKHNYDEVSAYDLMCRIRYDLMCRSVFGELSPFSP